MEIDIRLKLRASRLKALEEARSKTQVGASDDVAVCGVGACSCGATVVPHSRERAPIRCSNCRAELVERIIAGRKMAAD